MVREIATLSDAWAARARSPTSTCAASSGARSTSPAPASAHDRTPGLAERRPRLYSQAIRQEVRTIPRLGRKSEEEKAADAALKEQRRQEAEEGKRLVAIEKAKQDFFETPAGRARLAYESGDPVFQYAFDVVNHAAVVVAMVGSRQSKKTNDPVAVLNSVCHEGWELVNGSFVFVEEGSQSRDKFMSSGQNVAVKGTTVGYYLFRRSDRNKRETSNPWEQPTEQVTAPTS
jgi:hypothetical protein